MYVHSASTSRIVSAALECGFYVDCLYISYNMGTELLLYYGRLLLLIVED